MSLTRWEPLKEIEDLFDRYTMSLPWPRLRTGAMAGLAEWNPRVDIAESDEAYQIHADVPGVAKGDLRVSVQDGVLTIEGERKQEKRDDGTRIHRLERFYGSFTRSFTLPEDADLGGLKASSAEGQLTVTVPKKGSAPASDAVQVPVQ